MGHLGDIFLSRWANSAALHLMHFPVWAKGKNAQKMCILAHMYSAGFNMKL